MVILQPAKPLPAGALAAGLHARMGKRLRWFGRTAPGSPWVLLQSATPGEFVEFAACMLLADRNGAASHAQLDTFVRVMSELAPMLPAALSVPDVAAETDRAEALDRLCADVDVQVVLEVLKQDSASIPGTKLRGWRKRPDLLRRAAASNGRKDTGNHTLQNVRNEPFTVICCAPRRRTASCWCWTSSRRGSIARRSMKLAAKRIAQALTMTSSTITAAARRRGAGAIRQQVQMAADFKACRIREVRARRHSSALKHGQRRTDNGRRACREGGACRRVARRDCGARPPLLRRGRADGQRRRV
jgi:hypothetical protein